MAFFRVALPILLILAGVILYFSAFTVDVRERHIVLCLGKIERIETTPGLKFKYPWCKNKAFDNLVLTLDVSDDQQKISTGQEEKNFVVVDYFVMWRIKNPEKYFVKFRGLTDNATNQIKDYVLNALQAQFNNRKVEQIVSTDRQQIMDTVLEEINSKIAENDLGITVIDFRIKKIELDKDIQTAIHEEMKNERKKVATSTRAEGQRQSRRIRAEGERMSKEITAKAGKEAQIIKGNADAQANRIEVNAVKKNVAFYKFWKHLQSYENTKDEHPNIKNTIVITPDSDTWEYFKYLTSSKPERKSGN
jgi:membrane protease subunit HflC